MFSTCYSNGRKESKLKRRSGKLSQSVKWSESTIQRIKKHPKTIEQENLIIKAIQQNEFLSHILQGQRLRKIIETFYLKETEEDEVIVQKGEQGHHLFIAFEGVYKVIVNEKDIFEFDDVRVFGELAILYNAKRHATIKSSTKGKLWVLDSTTYRLIMRKTATEEQAEMVHFLQNIPIFNKMNVELKQVANLLRPEFLTTNTEIIREGDEADKFYIIRAGTVTVSKSDRGTLDQLSKGQFFGELAILKDKVRQATITADAPGVECLTLTSKQFIDHFGNDERFLNIKEAKEYSPIRAPLEYQNLNIADFTHIKTLGVGGYGRVELIQHSKLKDVVFALKYMKKREVVKTASQERVFNEKQLQMGSDSPFVARLYRTYKDEKYVYFLLEACLGGDLWTLMHKNYKTGFEETSAKFYAACMLEALTYLHKKGIVFRDLKPENIVIPQNGYAKLTDFGFAKILDDNEKTFTFVGTPEYVAPEIIRCRGHNKAVDYWAYGIFIYELLTCSTPFKGSESMKTYKLILQGIEKINFPVVISAKAKILIKKLCKNMPAERLGCQKGGTGDIRNHSWFTDFDWELFEQQKAEPPFIPNLKSSIDTKYFEAVKRDNNVPLSDFSGWDEEL